MDRFRIFDVLGLSQKLLEGSAALIPTDTLPALAASPEKASQLWDLKQRPADKPLILMGSNQNELFECVSPDALEDAQLMARRYWPGALTMVLPAKGLVVNNLNPGKFNIGMRIPACEVALALFSKTGPLATTSANLSGKNPCINEHEAAICFPSLPLLGPMPWPKPSGLASTLIFWQGINRWQVLRSGALMHKKDKY